MRISHNPFVAALIVTTTLLISCGGEKEEAGESSEVAIPAGPKRTEVTYLQLANGISLYMQEEHTDDKVAVEIFYRAGFTRDPAGQTQMSHITEHALNFAATDSAEAGAALNTISRWGRVAAQAQANCVHFDFLVPAEKLEKTISLLASQLRSARMEDAIVTKQTEKAVGEIDYILSPDGGGAVTRFAIMALCQVAMHGKTDVPVYKEPFTVTVEQVQSFFETNYRPDDMIIIVVGGFDSAAAERIIRRHFEGIPRRPDPAKPSVSLPENVSATWDIDAEGFFLVFPGPYADVRDRVALAMFGSYFRKYVSQVDEIRTMSRSVFTSSPVYPVGEMPYFIYGQARPPYTTSQMQETLERLLEEARVGIDENMLGAIKRNVRGFLEFSSITQITGFQERAKVVGQQATNVGFKHIFREGMSEEEMYAIIDSITLEDMNRIVNRFLSDGNKRVVTFTRK